MNKKQNIKNIDQIYENGLCTQCGACYGLCPKRNIAITRPGNKDYAFNVVNCELCKDCGICYKVCPGHAVDFDELNSSVFSKSSQNNLLGFFKQCYLTYATEETIRKTGASGGTVSALLTFALDSGMIDGALVVRMKENEPLEPEVFIAKSKQDILSAAQSKYCPVPMNVGLREVLQKKGKYAIVGLPCHMHAIRKAEIIIPELKERIACRIGLLCGPSPSFQMTDYLLKKVKVSQEDLAELKYREGDVWPGGMSMKLKDGTYKFIPHSEWTYAQTLFNRFRCTVCVDLTAELADISLGDAHLPEFWRNETVYTSDGRCLRGEDGWNLTISRTELGHDILQKAKDSKAIEQIEIDSGKAVEAQRSMLRYKKNTVFALTKILKFTNRKLPTYVGVAQNDNLAFHDYLKSLIVILSQVITSLKFGRWLLRKIPNRILTYKLKLRQKKIHKYINQKNR